ncbi:hypothetical protein Tco_1333580 [Tanacetum coccineum]
MNGHTADRCFELVGYPPNFKKSSFNKNFGSSNDVSENKDQSTSNSFTDDQFKKLMALISDKSGSSSMPANIADSRASQHMTYTILNMFNVVEVSKQNMIVGHPNGTKAVVTHVGSLRLNDQIVIHDVLVAPGYEDSIQRTQVGTGNESNGLLPSSVLSGKSPYELVFCSDPNLSHLKTFGCLCFSIVLNDFNKFSSLNFFNNDEDESKSDDPYDDRRDKEPKISEGIDHIPSEDTKNTSFTRRDDGEHPDDSEPAEAVIGVEENATLGENDKISKGDDSFYQEFNDMFHTPDIIPDRQTERC